ncbi:MAG: crossover junction endodeoxyribonuclease RuvC [Patescibacteria group bacterium]|jgi:crossover junction endodeoxyribonuclease RuvC
MTKERIILGIDPGTADTGYGVIKVKGSQLTCLTYGTIKTSATQSLAERLFSLDQELNKIIKQYQPSYVAVEQLFFNKNTKTALAVGQARGVILLAIAKNKLPYFEYTPPQVKLAVTSHGQANKLQVQKMVKLILGLKEIPQPDDAADALAIAITALNTRLCQKN